MLVGWQAVIANQLDLGEVTDMLCMNLQWWHCMHGHSVCYAKNIE